MFIDRKLNDEGTSTTEYAIGTIAAAALGAILFHVLTSDEVEAALTALIRRAMSGVF